jgi:hypothetical protein
MSDNFSLPTITEDSEKLPLEAQQTALLQWANERLQVSGHRLDDAVFPEDWTDEVFLALYESCTSEQLPRERGRTKVHQMTNLNAIIKALTAKGVRLETSAESLFAKQLRPVLYTIWRMRKFMWDAEKTDVWKQK